MFKRVAASAVLMTALLLAKDDGFAGKWVNDKQSSTATSDIPDGLIQQIKKRGDTYQIETVWRELHSGMAPLALLGIMITNLKLSENGQEIKNQIGPFMQTSKTTRNGNQLITDWIATVNGETVKGQWRRTLSDDAKQMTLEIQQSTETGKNNNGKLVFNRR